MRLRALTAVLVAGIGVVGWAPTIPYEIGQGRSDSWRVGVDRYARALNLALAHGSYELRRALGYTEPLSIHTRFVLTQNGRPLPSGSRSRDPGGDIVPTFELSGPRAFPASYRQHLEDTFASAEPFMDAIFGLPFDGGPVRILNYDADIPDRQAVAGGIFIPNAPQGPEVHFPVYQDPVSASINYIHSLLLAYLDDKAYPFDAFQEGLVRAAVIRIARSPGAIPGAPSDGQIEAALAALYDVGPFYDWWNRYALAGPQFIAPNLLNLQLPPGGSTGGLFLVRYQMAGSAWFKVLVEHPGFIKEFNARYCVDPSAFQTTDALIALAQQTLDFLNGQPGATVEGLPVAEWYSRQYVLDTSLSAGLKLHVQSFPISPQQSTDDFGVFAIFAHTFFTDISGNETLLAGTSYPIYWRPDFTRFFTTAQDDAIQIAGGFGSVAPNFPGATFNQEPYRVAVDVPFLDRLQRQYLPAGAVATGQSLEVSDLYGSVIGFASNSTSNITIDVQFLGGSALGIPVTNFAFGADIADPDWDDAQPVTVTIREDSVEVFSRMVNKSVGPLALDLRTPEHVVQFDLQVQNRLETIGIPIQPFRINIGDQLMLGPGNTLVARWNPTTTRYRLWPEIGEFIRGLGYFVRGTTVVNTQIDGFIDPNTPMTVALKPGWNQVASPKLESYALSDITVTTATEAIATWDQATGDIIGTTAFEFVPDNVNPDAGTMQPVTTFEPGKAYYVRALRAEGAALIFTPNGFVRSRVRGFQVPTGHLGRPDFWLGKRQPKEWRTRLELTGVNGQCQALIGQRSDTRPGYDPRHDCQMPPSPGGFQLLIQGSAGHMYRETGLYGTPQSFTIDAVGLIPGRRYTLRLDPIFGREQILVDDPQFGIRRWAEGYGTYHFNARGTTHRLILHAGGAR